MTKSLPFDPTTEPYINLSTFRKDGREVRTPVWVAAIDHTYYIFSESKAGKVKRIRNSSHVKIAACDARGKVKSEWLDADAILVSDTSILEEMYRAFDRKYGWQMRTLNFLSRLSGKYHRRAVIAVSIK